MPATQDTKTGNLSINCPRCKTYKITKLALNLPAVLEDLKKYAASLSGLSRLLAETGGAPLTIEATNLDAILDDQLIPKPNDVLKKAEILLKAIRRATRHFGHEVGLHPNYDISLAFAENYQELKALLDLLEQQGLLAEGRHNTQQLNYKLTAQGWQELKERTQNGKKGFVAMWFDNKDEMESSREATEAAITEAGFEPMCIKNKHYPETIVDKALGEIRGSRFVVVNLTGARSAVFVEFGFALGLGLDVILICDKKDKKALDFYSKQYKIYFYDNVEELEEVLGGVIKARISIT